MSCLTDEDVSAQLTKTMQANVALCKAAKSVAYCLLCKLNERREESEKEKI